MSALKKISKAAKAVLLVMLASLQGAAASEIDLKVPMLDVDLLCSVLPRMAHKF